LGKIKVARLVVRCVGIRDVRGQHFLALLTQTERRLIEVEVFANAIKHELYPGLPGRPEGRTSRLLPIYGLHSNLVYLLTKLEIEWQFSSNSLLVGSGPFIECFHAHTE